MSSLRKMPVKTHVKEVINGNTFRSDLGRIRLVGVRAPKLGRPEGQRAKQELEKLIGDQEVTVEPIDDQCKQIVATVRVDGLSVNEEMRRRLGQQTKAANPPSQETPPNRDHARAPSPYEMPSEPEETLMPLTDLCDSLEKVLSEFRKNFGKSKPGRLESNPDLIGKLAKIHECDEAIRKELLGNLHKTVPVVAESFEILIGGGWLVETGNGGCLILYNEGGVLARLNDENAGTPSNEDLCYHFSCAARLHYAGGTNIKIDTNLRKDKAQKCPVAVIPDGSRLPDVAGDWEGRRVVIECKRMSEIAGMDHVRQVAGDADRKMHKGDLRVITIDASSVVYRSEFMERPWGNKEIVGEVQEKLFRMRIELLKSLSNCDGLIVEATVPFAQETDGPSSCKYLWADFDPRFTDFFRKYAANPLRTDNALLRHREIGD